MFNPIRKNAGAVALVSSLALLTTPALAQETGAREASELQRQIDVLQREIETLRRDLAPRTAEEEAGLVRRSPDGGIQVGNTTLRFSGYVKADLSLSNNGFSNGRNYEIVTPSALKTLDDNQGNRVNLGARQSRFGFGTSTPVAGDTLTTFVSWDFYGEDTAANEFVSHGYAPRLREAYGLYRNLLIGQTWSTFTDLNGIGELIAFGQQANVNFVRQTMVRYTMPFDGGMFQVAIENPEDTGADHQDTPDMIARLTFRGGWGHVSAAGIARRLVLDDGVDRDTEWADAYSLTARFPTIGRDDIRLQVNYGNLGRYMGLRAYPDAVVDSGEIAGVDAWGASVFYRHYWTEQLRSTAAYSVSRIRDADTYSGTTTTHYDSAFLNLMWSPSTAMTYGIEYQYFDLEVADGDTFDLTRIALSAQFNF
ncbi:hypothetical protein K8B33_00470 [Alcanivorax sp. JB21]|uniref:DcaP family trimeric outer membrane transporter n=1 Tax=Alcanivorax limicola TaxID=2874102 RepID=UPI001CBA75ED|nr:DcaP family trimeric outer membrane transporter [Alcanivorax limicola]MBZ2187558.1 hypothetical protein [Alcanivorax limicola]